VRQAIDVLNGDEVMNVKVFVLAAFLYLIGTTTRADAASPTSPDIAKSFIRQMEKPDVDEAIKFWSGKAVNERIKDRIRKMSAKIVAAGGIKKLETPPVEKRPRNLEAHEVVVIVVYNDKNLAFGSISFVEEDGQFKISNIRSELGWGGTTSLFDEPGSNQAPEE
jgi:hypothetical protein